jgi:hypothetical protein
MQVHEISVELEVPVTTDHGPDVEYVDAIVKYSLKPAEPQTRDDPGEGPVIEFVSVALECGAAVPYAALHDAAIDYLTHPVGIDHAIEHAQGF